MTLLLTKELRAAASARGEALCALVPTLRMAAVGLTRRVSEADDLVHDILLQGLILGDRWEERELLPQLLSRMRNTFYTRTPLAGWTCSETRDAPEGASFAARVFALPMAEREAVILVTLLGAKLDQACGLCGCGEPTLRAQLGRGHRLLGMAHPVPHLRESAAMPVRMSA